MTGPFPNSRTFAGFNAPCRVESDIDDLEVVQGEVPAELDGTFFRVGPDPQFPPMHGDDIPLNGDGMAFAFHFRGGRASLRSRWIRTQKFAAERAAGRALYGVYRNPFTDDPSVAGKSRGTANTNFVWHAGKLLALKEDSLPVEIDPRSLETRGDWNFYDDWTHPTFTAHPKVDPLTGEMHCFGYEARGEATPDVVYAVVDRDGRVTRKYEFAVPYACMLHDFGVTREHVVFAVTPLVSDLALMKRGGPHFAWDGSRPAYVGIFSRAAGPCDIRWFTGPTCFSSHVMNAFTEGSRVHFDTPVSEIVVFPFFPFADGSSFDPQRATPHLERWTFDLGRGGDSFEREAIDAVVAEFPCIDGRFAMSRHRHGWTVSRDPVRGRDTGASLSGKTFNALAHYDMTRPTGSGRTTLFYAGDECGVQEPVFVPRPGSHVEGDGYVMALVNRLSEMRNDLVILDAQRVDAPPLAMIRLPMRLRNGLHGIWVERQAIQ
jgi:carotenoid cleavage dioxygenase-like enzyme